MSGQQLKTIVAKGQLKPEHLVRRGGEGPWVPAGRIKGLFPEGPGAGAQTQGKSLPQATTKPLPRAAAKPDTPPSAKATRLPTAAEAPTPPAADIPQELLLGGHRKHHVEMNVDSLNIEATPVSVSRRKVRAGLKGMKKGERKKLTMMLLCLIGGGTLFALTVILWRVVLSDAGVTPKPGDAKDSTLVAQAAESGNTKAEKKPAGKKPVQDKEAAAEPANWPSLSNETVLGDVDVKILKPTRGAPPEGSKAGETEVFVVQVRLILKAGPTKQLTSWTDESLRKKVSLKDDQNQSYALLEQLATKGSDGKTITADWTFVQLVFQAPTNKNLKYLHLTLPAAAFQADGTIYCQIDQSEISSGPAKSPQGGKAENPTRSDEAGPAESASKGSQK